MAKERLGKFQKWVLVHAYLKVVKKELPPDWIQPQAAQQNIWDKEKYLEEYSGALFKTEILANYFKLNFLNTSYSKYAKPWKSLFRSIGKDKKPHNNAMVTCSRSLINMAKKGFINWEPGEVKITLTEAGIAKAKEIIERVEKPGP